jgi:tripartite-type tricarboxylate transporter receptor subunit TctC
MRVLTRGLDIGTATKRRTPAAINATLYEKLNFNFIRDIAPIASLIGVPEVFEVNPSFPAKTVPEFIAYAKAQYNGSPCGRVAASSRS